MRIEGNIGYMSKEFKNKVKKILSVMIVSGIILASFSIYLIIKQKYLIGILSGLFSICFIIGWICVLGDLTHDNK